MPPRSISDGPDHVQPRCRSVCSIALRRASAPKDAADLVWTFALVPENGSTRLISRNRIAIKGSSAGQRLGMLVMEPGSLVMERKMLLGIKKRAERLAAEHSSEQGPNEGR